MARDVPRDWMWSEACEMLARAERLHRELFRPTAAPAQLPAWEPPVDILETEFEVWPWSLCRVSIRTMRKL